MAVFALEYYWVLRRILRKRPELWRALVRCRHCRIFFFTHPRNGGRVDLGCPFGCRVEHQKRESARRSAKFYSTEAGKLKKKLHNANRGQAKDESAQEEASSQDDGASAAASPSAPEPAAGSRDSVEETAAERAEDAGVGHRADKLEVNQTVAKLREGRGEEQAPAVPIEAEETGDSESPQKHSEEPEAQKGPAAGETRADPASLGACEESSESAEGDEFAEGIIEHVQLLGSLIDGEDLSRGETIELLRRVMRQRSIAKESALDYALDQLKKKPP